MRRRDKHPLDKGGSKVNEKQESRWGFILTSWDSKRRNEIEYETNIKIRSINARSHNVNRLRTGK